MRDSMTGASERRVIIATDDRDLAGNAVMILKSSGFLVEIASSPEEALPAAERLPARAVLIDIPPGTDRWADLLRDLKKACPETVCIMVAGFAEVPVAVESLAVGACDYIRKPIHPEDLLRVLGRCLERENRIRESAEFVDLVLRHAREPLRKMRAFADILSHKPEIDGAGRDYAGRIEKSACRLSRLADDVAQYMNVNRSAISPRRVDLGKTVKDVLAELESQVSQVQARVVVERLPQIEADPFLMGRLFFHLVRNSLWSQAADAMLKVYLNSQRMDDGVWEITLEDNGTELDRLRAERTFLPFEWTRRSGGYDGSGLDLAICEKIVCLHGGRITAESVSPKGARFAVVLPEKKPKRAL